LERGSNNYYSIIGGEYEMKQLLRGSKQYIRSMDLCDMALIKLCLLSVGILIGLCIPSRSKKCMALLASILFGGTFIPLMGKFVPAVRDALDS